MIWTRTLCCRRRLRIASPHLSYRDRPQYLRGPVMARDCVERVHAIISDRQCFSRSLAARARDLSRFPRTVRVKYALAARAHYRSTHTPLASLCAELNANKTHLKLCIKSARQRCGRGNTVTCVVVSCVCMKRRTRRLTSRRLCATAFAEHLSDYYDDDGDDEAAVAMMACLSFCRLVNNTRRGTQTHKHTQHTHTADVKRQIV